METNYPEGTVCRVDTKHFSYNPSKYVYIKKPVRFNRYKCYPCDVFGEIIEFTPIDIPEKYLFKRTHFPHFEDDDLMTCVQVLAILNTLREKHEIDLSVVENLIDPFTKFSQKTMMNSIAWRLCNDRE